jgi:hypothetical protein
LIVDLIQVTSLQQSFTGEKNMSKIGISGGNFAPSWADLKKILPAVVSPPIAVAQFVVDSFQPAPRPQHATTPATVPPPTNLNLPASLQPSQALSDDSHVPYRDSGEMVRSYRTGENITRVSDGHFDSITPAACADTKAKQTEICSKMSVSLGHQVSNPPSLADAQSYFQKVAKSGTAAEIAGLKTEYGDFLKTFYVHSGHGVTWQAGANLANNLEASLRQQPKLADGRTLIDCEGFAALNECILGPIQDPKTRKPMFEMMHAESGDHIATGFFKKDDPLRAPFTVNNEKVSDVPPEKIALLKKMSKPGQATGEVGQRWLLRGELGSELPAQKFGRKMHELKPL